MANYHFEIRRISRGKGQSATAAVAYACREKLRDDFYGKHYDYTKKKDILYREVFLPAQAPAEFSDLQTLCSEIERAEKRLDSQTLRDIKASLPNEISLEDQTKLVQEFIFEHFVSRGMCAIAAIHEGRNENPAKNNPHAHILLTTRPIGSEGFCAKKEREWNKREYIRLWREQWAYAQNRIYERKGLEVRVTDKQRIDREPRKHLSRVDWMREQRGIRTRIGDENRAIMARNREREERELLRRQEIMRERILSRERTR